MLKELYDAVQTSAAESHVARVIVIDKDPTHVHVQIPGKEIVEMSVAAPPRKSVSSTIASFAAAFSRYGLGQGSAVWVSMTSVAAVLNDAPEEHRHQLLTLPVVPSPLFQTIEQVLPKTNKQEPLVHLIRKGLKPSVIIPDTFELAIANLKWESSSTTEGNLGTVKSTMGRSITAEVKGEKDIGIEVSIRFEAFPALSVEFDSVVQVDCSVVVDPQEETITVTPYPGSMDKARAQAVELLRAQIAEKLDDATGATVYVFAGTP